MLSARAPYRAGFYRLIGSPRRNAKNDRLATPLSRARDHNRAQPFGGCFLTCINRAAIAFPEICDYLLTLLLYQKASRKIYPDTRSAGSPLPGGYPLAG